MKDPAQIHGAPTIDNDLKLWGNFGRFLGDGLQLYGHANYASETVTGGFFFRNPNTRAGVFSLDGGKTLLVGDVLDAQDGVLDGSADCPVVTITNWVPDPVALARVREDPNCFTYQEPFPGGFTPQFGGDVLDASVVAGLRGHTHGGLLWDLSAGYGRNAIDFFIDNTVNASLGPESPSSFDPGIYQQSELNLNVDVNYTVSDMVNVAGGAEFRDEHFEIGIGETPPGISVRSRRRASGRSNGFRASATLRRETGTGPTSPPTGTWKSGPGTIAGPWAQRCEPSGSRTSAPPPTGRWPPDTASAKPSPSAAARARDFAPPRPASRTPSTFPPSSTAPCANW